MKPLTEHSSWSEFTSPQFVLAFIVVLGWFVVLIGPLRAVSGLFGTLSANTASQQALHSGVQSILALSGLFSTVVGTVFGYYFGSGSSRRAEAQSYSATARAAVAEHKLSQLATGATAHPAAGGTAESEGGSTTS